MKNYRKWGKTVIAAFITGAASSVLSVLGVSGAQVVGVSVQQLTLKQLLAMTISGGVVGAAAYLKQAPVPPDAPDSTKPL